MVRRFQVSCATYLKLWALDDGVQDPGMCPPRALGTLRNAHAIFGRDEIKLAFGETLLCRMRPSCAPGVARVAVVGALPPACRWQAPPEVFFARGRGQGFLPFFCRGCIPPA